MYHVLGKWLYGISIVINSNVPSECHGIALQVCSIAPTNGCHGASYTQAWMEYLHHFTAQTFFQPDIAFCVRGLDATVRDHSCRQARYDRVSRLASMIS